MRYLLGFLCMCALGMVPLVGCVEDDWVDHCETAECDDGNECTEDVCNPADGSCSNLNLADGSFCDAGYCQSGECEPITSVFPCHEQGILDAIAAGAGPHGFDCNGPTVVTTAATIVIDNDVILDGRGDLTVDGDEDHPVFSVPVAVEAELRRFAVTGGFSDGVLGGGGGISNEGTLTVSSSTVSENSAGDGAGGGISNAGTMTLTNTVVSGNSAGAVAVGGIMNEGSLTISNSTVSGNSAGAPIGVGGIGNIASSATLIMTNSTASENTGSDDADEQYGLGKQRRMGRRHI